MWLQKRRGRGGNVPGLPPAVGQVTGTGWGQDSPGVGDGRVEKGAQVGPLLWSRGLKGSSVLAGEVSSEAGGRGQGQCLKGPPCPAKGIGGPELTRLFGFVQLLRVLDV